MMAELAARKYGIDPQVFLRQISQESGFNPNAKSDAGAEGIAQFMPSTAAGFHINPWDPQQALDAAALMDSRNIKKYGGWAPALSAYNSGRADAYKDPNFAGGQTYRYVKDILGGSNVPTAQPAARGGVAISPPNSQLQQALAAMLLTNGGVSPDPLAQSAGLLQMAMLRKQLGAAHQVYGPTQASSGQQFQPHSLAGGRAGGFLPKQFSYKPGRLDQGHDFQTDPGAPIIAPGDGVVVRVASDPHGFGPAYPIVHFTSGPYAGRDVYIGHTLSQVRPGQRFARGQVLSHTGTHPIGNASVPGWAEIGFAPNGTPGPDGQSVPF